MKYFKKPNIFTLLIVLAAFAFAFRLVDAVTFRGGDSGAFKTAAAVVQEQETPAAVLTPTEMEKPADAAPVTEAAEMDAPPEAMEGEKPSFTADSSARAFSTSEIEILQSLSRRREELEKRERELERRGALLQAAEQEVDSKISELNKLKGEMEELLGKQKEAEEARIVSLVKIYENMKPKEAARIFDTLEMSILLDVIGRMNERKASPVLASMDPEKARQVTIELAEQRRMPSSRGKTETP